MATMLERIYAGFLGMNAGIRLGAPVEPAAWDFDRIAKFYGEIKGYVRDYKNFAADDDVKIIFECSVKHSCPETFGAGINHFSSAGIGKKIYFI